MRSHARELAASGPKPFGAVDMELLRKAGVQPLVPGEGIHGEEDKHVHVQIA